MSSEDRKNMLLQISDLCPKYDYIRKRKSGAIISKTEMEEFKADFREHRSSAPNLAHMLTDTKILEA